MMVPLTIMRMVLMLQWDDKFGSDKVNVRLIFLVGTGNGCCHHGARLVSSVEDEFGIIQCIIWFPFAVIEDFLFISICLLVGTL